MMIIQFVKATRITLPDGKAIWVAPDRDYEFDDVTGAWLKRNWPDLVADESKKPRARRKPKRAPKRTAFDEPPVEK